YDQSTGTLSFDRNWSAPPASAEVYQVFSFFPPVDQPGVPYSWDRAVREGLGIAWFIDRVNLGEGGGNQTRFSLASWPGINARTWRRVFLSCRGETSAREVSAQHGGRFVTPVSESGDFALDIFPAPSATETVLVEAVRTDAALYADTDVTNCPLK